MTKRIILENDKPTRQRPPRQGHRKSRKGCIRCKQRRVKCNEQAPCQNCLRRHEPCSLEHGDELTSRHSLDSSSVTLEPDHSSSSDPWSFLPQLQLREKAPYDGPREIITHQEWCTDLYLMHNYARFVHTLVSSRHADYFWNTIVVDEAMKHPWLTHGLLSLSACQLSHTRPDEDGKYLLLISHHQQMALPGFREALSKRSAENCRALFAMAAIFPILSIAEVSRGYGREDTDDEKVIDALAQSLILSRGLHTALDPLWHFLVQPPLETIGDGSSMEDYSKYTLPFTLMSEIRKLDSFLINSKLPQHAYDACSRLILKLEQVYIDILFMDPAERDPTGVLFKWAVCSEQIFHGLLSNRDVVALVLTAHWVILISALDPWYVNGFSSQALKSVMSALPDSVEVRDAVRWPQEQLAQGLPAFHGHKFGRLP